MRASPKSLLLALALLLSACAEQNALRDAQALGTPEAYEAYLTQFPSSPKAPVLRTEIEELRYSRAKNGTSVQHWRDYLTNHPQGKNVKSAVRFEDELSFADAVATRTAAGFQSYLDSHPNGKFVLDARAEMDEVAYLEFVTIDGYRVERLNLANDPKGPENGWGLYANVTNGGDRILVEVEVRMVFLSASGEALDERTWWVVAPGLLGMPTPPAMIPPLRPDNSREFRFTTGEPPDGWTDAFRLEITNLRFRA